MEEQTLKLIPKPPILTIASCLIGFFILAALYFRFVGPIPVSMTSTVTTRTDLFTTTGESKATAVPDIAKVNLGITANAQTAKEVQNQANQTINKITSDLKKLGIEDKDIKTTSYNLNPNYDWSEGRQRITGYQITINLEVKVRDFDKINSVIDTATADGANLVGGLQFTLNDDKLKDLRQEAREEAVGEAKSKAESLASAAGINLGRIVNVQENLTSPFEPRPIPMMALEKSSPDEPTQIEPGEQEIKVSISLSYELR